MSVVDTDVGGRRGGKYLTLIFKAVISLSNSDGEITGGVRFQVGVPEKKIGGTATSEAIIERGEAQTQHDLSNGEGLKMIMIR